MLDLEKINNKVKYLSELTSKYKLIWDVSVMGVDGECYLIKADNLNKSNCRKYGYVSDYDVNCGLHDPIKVVTDSLPICMWPKIQIVENRIILSSFRKNIPFIPHSLDFRDFNNVNKDFEYELEVGDDNHISDN